MMIKAHNHGDPSPNGESRSSTGNTHNKGRDSKNAEMTIPTLMNPCAEDKPKNIDISRLQCSKGVSLVFGGTDITVLPQ
jgi:hypothetical protein